MRPFKSLISGSVIFCLIALVSSCEFDKLPVPPPPTLCETLDVSYETDIRPILDNSCAYAGCHVTAPPGDWRTYDGIKPAIDAGLVQMRVFDLRNDPNMGMPPDWAPPGKPKDLTQEEIDKFNCWIEEGYPRN